MKIAIIGAGAYGTALGQVLLENGYEIQYYDPALENTTLESALDGAETIVLAAPSGALDDILPRLPHNIPMIVTTKGILDDSVLKPFEDIMVLSGPGFADDIKAHKTTLLTASDARVETMFATEYLAFDRSDDVKGMLMCGALKNVYALLAGLLDLKPGTLEHEKFLTVAAEEMREILEANGAKGATVDLACGKGDLRLTCDLPSRNYGFGQALRANAKSHPEKTVEGLTTLHKIIDGVIVVPESAKHLKDLMERSETWG